MSMAWVYPVLYKVSSPSSPSTACNQAGLGVAAVFGPRSNVLASHVNSMCSSLEVPHVEVRLEPQVYRIILNSILTFP